MAPVQTATGAPVHVVDRTGSWAVLGAGPHGLAALKALQQYGIAAQGYEQAGDVGGNWNTGSPTSRVTGTTRTVSTKPFTQFPDFPMPDSYPDYPGHRQVQTYLQRYAEHFGLAESIAFGTEVVAVGAADPDAVDLTVRDVLSGATTTYRHAGVVLANGHNHEPRMPRYPRQDGFAAEILHSAQYTGPDMLRGRRVLVVGGGNTGCDIAVDAAQHAEAAFHSTRRGYWYAPKYVLGKASDQFSDLLLALHVPMAVRRLIFRGALQVIFGDLTRYGMAKPDHKFYETHPVINQLLPYYVQQGQILAKPDIEQFDDRSVVFTDGSAERVDVVVFATGYRATFPFADPALLGMLDNRPRLGRQMFSPTHPGVVVSGLIQPDSGQWALAHWQGVLIAQYARALRDRPEHAAAYAQFAAGTIGHRYSGGARYDDSQRHAFEVAHQEYLRAIEHDIRLLEGSL
jgi:cation diffusion facilitator CzcD-associated flavoprotein CzcO